MTKKPTTIPYDDGQVRIIELLGSGDEDRLNAMLDAYRQLFPDYAHYTERMKKRAERSTTARAGHIAHYWLIEVEEEPAGMSTFRYINKRNCGLGIAFGLLPSFRSIIVDGTRLSKFVILEILRQLAKDSLSMGKPEYWGLVTEVEHQNLMDHYKQMGMHELPIRYYEPIFSSANGEKPQKNLSYEPVILGITPNPKVGFQKYNCDTLSDFAKAFLVDHYRLPEDHEVVLETLDSVRGC